MNVGKSHAMQHASSLSLSLSLLLSNTQLARFQALPFASVSPSVLMKSCLEGDIS